MGRDMTDWSRGGVLGSVDAWVRREIAEQRRNNPLARKARYRWPLRLLRSIFSARTFYNFLALYLLIDLSALCVEAWSPWVTASIFPRWAASAGAAELLKSVPSYLIGAQVGVFSVISLALALVTLIAQRDEAAADVQVYYHESLFFEVAASCLALIAVLAIQLFWPLQFGLHLLGHGGHASLFKLGLLTLHLGWFLINLAAVAHFIAVTFGFVHNRARERLRERYTANVVVPNDLTGHLRAAVYSMAGSEAVPTRNEDELNVSLFGISMPEPYIPELTATFRKPMRLKNVFVRPAHWAIRRWHQRCDQPSGSATAATLPDRIALQLWFTPRIAEELHGEIIWCRRKGGVPLDWLERAALRFAFRFERVRDAD
ncbi:MAG: hypothetical protein JWR80_6687 [Bradyrhizobium sp.]|nr:hypothetical protein [Bradyrhizobium sp.]